jgi:predicted nucleic acid-binding Zn finger protein
MEATMLCSDEVINHFLSYEKLLEAINMKRFLVLINRDNGLKIYVFKGINKDYLVSPCRICTCSDFIINFIGRKRGYPCYHVVGFAIAEKLNKLSYIELDNNMFTSIVYEIVFQGMSFKLRKILKG